MSGTTGAGSYRVLLRDRPLRRVFVVSLLGRFGYALLPLCLLFTIARATGSFAVAATATATFGVSGLVMPLQARLIDRLGQRRVLTAAGGWFTGVLLLVAVGGATGVGSDASWVTLCAAGGAGAPALGPSMRAQWRAATKAATRSTAYSLDAVAEEVVFLLGPLAASAVLALGPAWYGVAVVAVLMPVGVLGLLTSRHVPPVVRTTSRGPRTPWQTSRFRRLLVLMAVSGGVASAVLTLLAGVADQRGRSEVTGLVEAAAGVAAVLGGLVWSRRAPAGSWPRLMAVLLVVRVPLLVVAALAPGLLTLGVAVAVSGLAVAPTYVVAFRASDQETDAHHHTEASTWVTSANNLGTALGTAIAGQAVSQVRAGVAACAALLVVAATTALVGEGPGCRQRRDLPSPGDCRSRP